MFRALLWKEWRELWVLPVAAAPLAAINFWLINLWAVRPTPVAWDIGFPMWLCIAAIYIPTHLFAREKEMDTAGFLFSRPLDRFRLWWFRLLVGIATLAAVGVVLYLVVTVFSYTYGSDHPFRTHQVNTIQTSISIAFILLSLGCLYSAVLGKQLRAIAGVVLTSLVLVTVGSTLSGPSYRLTINFGWGFFESFAFALLLCPALLVVSLAIYARGSLWKSTKARIGLVYSLTVLAALLPTAAGIARVFPPSDETLESNETIKPEAPAISILDQSEDRSRLLLKAYHEDALVLVTVDLSTRKVNVIDKGIGIWGRMSKSNGDEIAYQKHTVFNTIFRHEKWFVSDFEGSNRREFPQKNYLYFWQYLHRHKFSLNGNYVNLIKNPDTKWGEDGYVAIADSEGNILHKHEIPILEGSWIRSVGWDFKDRFYFIKTPEGRSSEFWRMQPDTGGLEKISFLPEPVSSNCSVVLSPDGRWIRYGVRVHAGRQYKGWLCNISTEKSRLVSEYTNSFLWSKDSRKIAFVEEPAPYFDVKSGAESDESVSSRLVIYNVQTGERSSIPLDDTWSIRLGGWSPSGDHLLAFNRRREPYMFTLESGQIEKIEPPTAGWDRHHKRWGRRSLKWTDDDKLLWTSARQIIVTEVDGSDPKEIFRVENGKFYLYGQDV